MISFGIRLVVRAYGTSGWRIYFRNLSVWHHTPPDAWCCLWGGPVLPPAWVLEDVRRRGLDAAGL